MTPRHSIRVTVEILGDGFSSKIASKIEPMLPHVPLQKHARFALAEALSNPELADWCSGGEMKFIPRKPK